MHTHVSFFFQTFTDKEKLQPHKKKMNLSAVPKTFNRIRSSALSANNRKIVNEKVLQWITKVNNSGTLLAQANLVRAYRNSQIKDRAASQNPFLADETLFTYNGLTEYFEKNNVPWQQLHSFRATMYNTVLAVVKDSGIMSMDGIAYFGSDQRTSDIDITLSDNPAEAALLIVFTLGVITCKLFRTEVCTESARKSSTSGGKRRWPGWLPKVSLRQSNGLDEKQVENLLRASLTILQPIFDIAVYSSNGVVRSAATLALPSERNLVQLTSSPVLYQVVRKVSCRAQNDLFLLSAGLLLTKLEQELKGVESLEVLWGTKAPPTATTKAPTLRRPRSASMMVSSTPRAMITPPAKLLGKYIERLPRTVKTNLETIQKMQEGSPVEQFHAQLYSSQEAFDRAQKIVTGPLEQKLLCETAAQWELFQIAANVVSPESAWSVDTFVVTVLELQRKLDQTVTLSSNAYWLVFVENLVSMIHHQRHADLRRAWKYGDRAAYSISLAIGRSISTDFSESEAAKLFDDDTYGKLRAQDKLSSGFNREVDEKLTKFIEHALKNVFHWAPVIVRDIEQGYGLQQGLGKAGKWN